MRDFVLLKDNQGLGNRDALPVYRKLDLWGEEALACGTVKILPRLKAIRK